MLEIFGSSIEIYYRLIINLVIVLSSITIFYRTHSLYKLSSYEGFRIFRNSFLFFAIAFSIDYYVFLIVKNVIAMPSDVVVWSVSFAFYFTLVMAGAYLVYSLLWKEFEKVMPFLKKDIFSNKDLLLVGDSIIIAGLTVFYNENIMFIIMIMILAYASHLSYNNYLESKEKKGKRNQFPQLYFIAILFTFLAYTLNYLVWFVPVLKYYVLSVTGILFLVFLYGVFYSAKKV